MKSAVLLNALWAAAAQALSTDDWKGQTIYQIVTDRFARTDGSTTASCNLSEYCGGTWQGIIDKLDYIQGMGFTAIWISPIVTNILEGTDGSSYHGYWAQDITTVNSNFGTESDLINLADQLHSRGMYLMVDMVTNHMGSPNAGGSVDYSIYTPFDSSSYFHTSCDIDYSSETSIETCWEVTGSPSLPDLRTEDDDVRTIWNNWIPDIISKFGIDGLRMDSTKHVEKGFWPDWVTASGVYNVGEVYNGDPSIFPDWLNYISGLLNYPGYYWITRAFESTSSTMWELHDGINTLKDSMTTSTFGNFMENHDQVRFASLTSDTYLIKNGIAYTMLADGIPIIYYGQEQQYSGGSDPNNREPLWTSGYSTSSDLYTFITTMNKIRRAAVNNKGDTYINYQAYPVSASDHVLFVRKDDVRAVFTNVGSGASTSYTVTGLDASASVCDAVGGSSYTADSSGNVALTVGPAPVVLVPTSWGICSTSTSGASSLTCSTVTVTFQESHTTYYGQNVYIVGNVAALGNWDTSSGVLLTADSYTDSNPLWQVSVALPPNTAIEYKFITVDDAGTTWESDPNRSFTTPACGAASTVSDTWR